jgi:hypothetical protein
MIYLLTVCKFLIAERHIDSTPSSGVVQIGSKSSLEMLYCFSSRNALKTAAAIFVIVGVDLFHVQTVSRFFCDSFFPGRHSGRGRNKEYILRV